MSLAKFALAAAAAATLTLTAIAPVFAQEAPMDANVIAIQGNAFTPPDLTVPAGTTLTWVNNDPEEHDVLPSDPSFSLDPNFFTPPIAPGMSWSYTFTVPGTYAYMCDLHVNMLANVNVT
jgi:plastocyanin